MALDEVVVPIAHRVTSLLAAQAILVAFESVLVGSMTVDRPRRSNVRAVQIADLRQARVVRKVHAAAGSAWRLPGAVVQPLAAPPIVVVAVESELVVADDPDGALDVFGLVPTPLAQS